jgi:hypothetical protein
MKVKNLIVMELKSSYTKRGDITTFAPLDHVQNLIYNIYKLILLAKQKKSNAMYMHNTA